MERIISIPTKHFIKDYILHCYNAQEMEFINAILLSVLANRNNELIKRDKKKEWECTVELIASGRTRLSNRDILNVELKAIYFNKIMAHHIRTTLFHNIKAYLKFDKNIKRAIDQSLSDLGIDEEHYTYDTIAKYYQRHREKLNLPTIYKQKSFKLCS